MRNCRRKLDLIASSSFSRMLGATLCLQRLRESFRSTGIDAAMMVAAISALSHIKRPPNLSAKELGFAGVD